MLIAELALVLGLILLNAFFAMSELAIVSARRIRLKQRAEAGVSGAQAALELSADPTRFLSTVQIGITLVGLLAGAISGATIAERIAAPMVGHGVSPETAELIAVVVVVLALTYLSLVFGELVPKRLALARPDAIATHVAPVLSVVSRFSGPVIELLRISTDGCLRLFGIQPRSQVQVTDEEVNALVAEGMQQGVIHPVERAMVEEVLRLADRPVRTIMTPRHEIVWLDAADTAEDVRRKIADTGYNRFPVCEGDLGNCLGYVRSRAIVDILLEGRALDLHSILRPVVIIPPQLKVPDLMGMFRRTRPHLAIVVDEYGATLGVVTPADILETIAGGLAEDTPAPPLVEQTGDGSWLVSARIELQDLERSIGAGGFGGAKFKTLAALILERLDHVPELDEVVIVNGWRLQVVVLDGRRIDKVLVSPLAVRPRA